MDQSMMGGYMDPDQLDLMQQQRKRDLAQQMVMGAKPAGTRAGGILGVITALLAGRQMSQADEGIKAATDRQNQRRTGDMENMFNFATMKPQGPQAQTNPVANDDEGNAMPAAPMIPGEAPDAFQARRMALARSMISSPNPQIQQFAMQQMMPRDTSAMYGKVDPKDFTPESQVKFAQTGRHSDLVPRDKMEIAPNGLPVNLYNADPTKNYGKVSPTSLGGVEALLNPAGQTVGALPRSQSPESVASNAVTIRGQNLTDARAGQGLAQQREAARQQYENTPSGPVLIDKATGQARAVTMNGQPIPSDATQKKAANATGVLDLLKQAETILPDATNSVLGAGYDLAGRVVGAAPKGAQAIAQLKAIEGALLMQMPRMEGPQSNYDVQNYKQAAGMLGDPTTPNALKQAAINAIREIQSRYKDAGAGGAPNQGPGSSGKIRVVNW